MSERAVPLRRKKSHIATLLVLANYLLALTAGGSFHDHRGHHRSEETGRCASRPCDDVSVCGQTGSGVDVPRHAHQDSPCRHGNSDPNSFDSCGGECPVCRFLAQKPITALEFDQTCFTPLDQDLAPATPARCAGDVPSSYRVRAPPAVA